MPHTNDSNSSEQRALVTDPHTGKVYDLTALFDYLSQGGETLEALSYQLDDVHHNYTQTYSANSVPMRDFQNDLFVLHHLHKVFDLRKITPTKE